MKRALSLLTLVLFLFSQTASSEAVLLLKGSHLRPPAADGGGRKSPVMQSLTEALVGEQAARDGARRVMEGIVPPAGNKDFASVTSMVDQHHVTAIHVLFEGTNRIGEKFVRSVYVPVNSATVDILAAQGFYTDGSSFPHYQRIHNSDRFVRLDARTFQIYQAEPGKPVEAVIRGTLINPKRAPAKVVLPDVSFAKKPQTIFQKLGLTAKSTQEGKVDKVVGYLQKGLGLTDATFVYTDGSGLLKEWTVPIGSKDHWIGLKQALLEGTEFLPNTLKEGLLQDAAMVRPDVNSVRVVHVGGKQRAVFYLDAFNQQGEEIGARSVLKKTQTWLRKKKMRAYFGPEPEFFLLRGVKRDAADRMVDAEPADRGVGYYFPLTDSPEDVQNSIKEIVEASASAGIVLSYYTHEVAEGQYELPFFLDADKDELTLAEDLLLYKWIVMEAAKNNGLEATFMPKPQAFLPWGPGNGSGQHTHTSIWSVDKTGKPIRNLMLDEKTGGFSNFGRQFAEGVLTYTSQGMLFFNRLVNSFKRLVAHAEAPTALSESDINRSAAGRIPAAKGNGVRIEFRFPDPMSNSFLAYSALIYFGIRGVEQDLEPRPFANFNIWDAVDPVKVGEKLKKPADSEEVARQIAATRAKYHIEDLPFSLDDATNLFERSAGNGIIAQMIMDGLMPASTARTLVAQARQEIASAAAHDGANRKSPQVSAVLSEPTGESKDGGKKVGREQVVTLDKALRVSEVKRTLFAGVIPTDVVMASVPGEGVWRRVEETQLLPTGSRVKFTSITRRPSGPAVARDGALRQAQDGSRGGEPSRTTSREIQKASGPIRLRSGSVLSERSESKDGGAKRTAETVRRELEALNNDIGVRLNWIESEEGVRDQGGSTDRLSGFYQELDQMNERERELSEELERLESEKGASKDGGAKQARDGDTKGGAPEEAKKAVVSVNVPNHPLVVEISKEVADVPWNVLVTVALRLTPSGKEQMFFILRPARESADVTAADIVGLVEHALGLVKGYPMHPDDLDSLVRHLREVYGLLEGYGKEARDGGEKVTKERVGQMVDEAVTRAIRDLGLSEESTPLLSRSKVDVRSRVGIARGQVMTILSRALKIEFTPADYVLMRKGLSRNGLIALVQRKLTARDGANRKSPQVSAVLSEPTGESKDGGSRWEFLRFNDNKRRGIETIIYNFIVGSEDPYTKEVQTRFITAAKLKNWGGKDQFRRGLTDQDIEKILDKPWEALEDLKKFARSLDGGEKAPIDPAALERNVGVLTAENPAAAILDAASPLSQAISQTESHASFILNGDLLSNPLTQQEFSVVLLFLRANGRGNFIYIVTSRPEALDAFKSDTVHVLTPEVYAKSVARDYFSKTNPRIVIGYQGDENLLGPLDVQVPRPQGDQVVSALSFMSLAFADDPALASLREQLKQLLTSIEANLVITPTADYVEAVHAVRQLYAGE